MSVTSTSLPPPTQSIAKAEGKPDGNNSPGFVDIRNGMYQDIPMEMPFEEHPEDLVNALNGLACINAPFVKNLGTASRPFSKPYTFKTKYIPHISERLQQPDIEE